MNIIDSIEKEGMRTDIPAFNIGDTVKVFVKVVDGTVSGTNSALRIYGDAGSDIDIIVEGGAFTAPAKQMFYVADTNANITITGGNFNGKSFADLVKGGADAWNAYCDNSCHATISADGKTVTISK